MTLSEIRKKIDALDERIILLLNERADLVHEVGLVKKAEGSSIYVPEREEQVLRSLAAKARELQSRLPEKSIRAIYREIMSASLALEKDLAIAFLGPETTEADHAARSRFGASVTYTACENVAEVFDAVARGKADYGVVPIDGPDDGTVDHILEIFLESELRICAQIIIRADVHLAAAGAGRELRKLYSHPQIFAQCRRWLRQQLPAAELVEVASTPAAARLALEDPETGALVGTMAAETPGLRVISRSIQDDPHVTARFLVIGHRVAQPTGDDRTSLLFSLQDQPGALSAAIEPFRRLGINMSEIESRPAKPRPWRHFFFVDIEGHATEPKVAEAIAEFSQRCTFVKVLGTYPKSAAV